jgi:hypothetical protein
MKLLADRISRSEIALAPALDAFGQQPLGL